MRLREWRERPPGRSGRRPQLSFLALFIVPFIIHQAKYSVFLKVRHPQENFRRVSP
jgi:hypothetical protein